MYSVKSYYEMKCQNQTNLNSEALCNAVTDCEWNSNENGGGMCKYKDVPFNSAMSEGCGGLTGKGVDERDSFAYSDGLHKVKWVEQTMKLIAPDSTRSDLFGSSVALYGNTALIGAVGDDENATSAGSVYIFTRQASGASSLSNVSLWIGQTKIYASDPKAGDMFGNAVSLYGDTALIGAFQDDDKGINTGRVYVFKAPPPRLRRPLLHLHLHLQTLLQVKRIALSRNATMLQIVLATWRSVQIQCME